MCTAYCEICSTWAWIEKVYQVLTDVSLVSLGTNIGLLHHKTLLKKCWKLREGNILSININLRQICSISYLYPFQCNQIYGAPDDTTSFFLGIRQNMLSFFNIFDFKKISVKMYNMASFWNFVHGVLFLLTAETCEYIEFTTLSIHLLSMNKLTYSM